jgi:hypothetical protein
VPSSHPALTNASARLRPGHPRSLTPRKLRKSSVLGAVGPYHCPTGFDRDVEQIDHLVESIVLHDPGLRREMTGFSGNNGATIA